MITEDYTLNLKFVVLVEGFAIKNNTLKCMIQTPIRRVPKAQLKKSAAGYFCLWLTMQLSICYTFYISQLGMISNLKINRTLKTKCVRKHISA